MTNDNLLKGVKCPKCGHDKDFVYTMRANFLVTDDSIEIDEHPDFDLDGNVRADCLGCRYEAPLHLFQKKD